MSLAGGARAFAAGLLVASSLLGPGATPAPAQPAPGAVVTADFSHPRRVRSVVGLLHGMDAARPPARLIRPLAPLTWRGNLFSAPYGRATGFGARYIIVLSDLWGYPGANWYGGRAPWEDLGRGP